MWRVYGRGNRQQTAGDRKSSLQLFCSGELKKSDACFTQWPARDILNIAYSICIDVLPKHTFVSFQHKYIRCTFTYRAKVIIKTKQRDKNTLDIYIGTFNFGWASMLSEIFMKYTEVGNVLGGFFSSCSKTEFSNFNNFSKLVIKANDYVRWVVCV